MCKERKKKDKEADEGNREAARRRQNEEMKENNMIKVKKTMQGKRVEELSELGGEARMIVCLKQMVVDVMVVLRVGDVHLPHHVQLVNVMVVVGVGNVHLAHHLQLHLVLNNNVAGQVSAQIKMKPVNTTLSCLFFWQVIFVIFDDKFMIYKVSEIFHGLSTLYLLRSYRNL